MSSAFTVHAWNRLVQTELLAQPLALWLTSNKTGKPADRFVSLQLEVGGCHFNTLMLSSVVPAGHSYCPGLPGVCCPHHLAGVCSQDSLQDQTLGSGTRSLGGSKGHQWRATQQHRRMGEFMCLLFLWQEFKCLFFFGLNSTNYTFSLNHFTF